MLWSLPSDLNGRTPPSANASRTRGKPFVVAHDQLRLNLIDGVHRYADDNQQRRSAKVEIHSQAVQQPAREMRIDKIADSRQALQLDSGNHDLRNNREHGQV